MPTTAAFPDLTVILTVARQFDDQILTCAEDEVLSHAQRSDLLAWAQEHLISAHLAPILATVLLGKSTGDQLTLCPDCNPALGMVGDMLQGGLPLGPDLTFRCPPSADPGMERLRHEILTIIRSRITQAAQQTREHTAEELALLLGAVEAHFLVSAIRHFGLDQWLDADVPSDDDLIPTTQAYLTAVVCAKGLAWTSGGVLGEAMQVQRKVRSSRPERPKR